MSYPQLPQVVIIGRPNVGKSTLFNRLVGKKVALVDDQPGVTRDRRKGIAGVADLTFEAVDTAGWEDEDDLSLPGRMRAQTQVSLRGADAALFVIDSRAGVTPLDEEIGQWLREQEVPVILIANKAEGNGGQAGIIECWSLGLGEPVPVSAEHGEGIAELYTALIPLIGDKVDQAEIDAQQRTAIAADKAAAKAAARAAREKRAEERAALRAEDPSLEDELAAAEEEEYDLTEEDEEEADPRAPLSLAIVGRPNAGKSTLINRMLGEDRLLTGPEAGITRDAIAVDWIWHDPKSGEDRIVKLVDTAGMRKRAKVTDKLEKLAVFDGLRAIDYAEVVVLLLDATRGLEVQDLKIASRVIEEGRALIIAINKWDVAEDTGALFQGIRAALEEGLSQLKGVPLLAVSALTGKGLDILIAAAFKTRDDWSRRVSTGALNRWFDEALDTNPPPAPGGRRIKLRYITQAGTRPPRFVIFGTRLDQLPGSYERYLLNAIRRDLGFGAVPVRLTLKSAKNPFV